MSDHIASIRALTLEDLEKASALTNTNHEENIIYDRLPIINNLNTNKKDIKIKKKNKQ